MTSVLAVGIACAVLVVLAGLCIGRVMRALDSLVETERPWNLTEGVQQSMIAASAGDTTSLRCTCGDQGCPGGPAVHSPVRADGAVQADNAAQATIGAHPG